MTSNNGSSGIKADGCASCHRIHTSKSPTGFLLVSNESTVTNYCRSCHGATGTGASTDVDTGVQYAIAGVSRDTATTIGALRGGGFVEARIGADAAYRLVSNTGSVSNSKVPVGAAEPVTSAHIAIATGVTAKNVVWGNGNLGTAGAGRRSRRRWNARPAITRTGTATTASSTASRRPGPHRPWRAPRST